MTTGFFLIPTAYISKGRIPLDYRVERKNIDRRTRFYRNYKQWKAPEFLTAGAAKRMGLRVFREDGKVTRILAPDAKTARAFFEYMQNFDFGKERSNENAK